jgi:hypothetical protein
MHGLRKRGACDLGATRFSLVHCWSDNHGQFLFIARTDITRGLSASDHAVSEVTAVACGTKECDDGTISLESPVSASFRILNT